VHSLVFLGRSLVERYGLAALALAALGCRPLGRVRTAWLAALVWSIFALNYPFVLLYELPGFAAVRFPFGWRYLGPVFVGLLVASGLASLLVSARRGPRAAAVVLALATVAHAEYVLLRAPRSMPLEPPSRTLVDARVPVLRSLLPPGARLASPLELASGAPLRHRVPSPAGYEPSLPPHRIVALLQALGLYRVDWATRPLDVEPLTRNADLAALLGIGLVTVPHGAAEPLTRAGFTMAGSVEPAESVLMRPPLPRARIVHRALVAGSEAETLAAVVAAPRAPRAVLPPATARPILAEPPPGARDEAVIVADEPERVAVQASMASPGLLVLRDTFYPGWQATVDGQATPVLCADHAFRAVPLAAGEHEVVFRYAPRSLRLGAAVSAAAMLVTLGLLVRARGRRAST
jgi:hypothetical protein